MSQPPRVGTVTLHHVTRVTRHPQPCSQAGSPLQPLLPAGLQVIDETKGPITKKDYELVMAPAGDSLMGKA